MMCGQNGNHFSEMEFLAGCNRFGLDNPTPIISARVAPYGNAENLEQLIYKLGQEHQGKFDSNMLVSQLPDKKSKVNCNEEVKAYSQHYQKWSKF